ncbi:MAG TPA: carboxypeptidase-like regulatory domain-containing protein [Ilumatobacteraceae bacterium]
MNDFEQTDDEVLALLGDALQHHEPVPDRVLTGARAAFTWRTIDAELAELVFDSALEGAGVRSDDIARQVTFQAPGVEIEVMLIDDGSRRLVGQLVPATEVTVELTSGDRVSSAHSDRLGRFGFDDIEPGPVRLTVLGSSGERLVHTEWVLF